MKNMMYVIILLALAGFVDSAYLTYEHYQAAVPPCSNHLFVDCGKVLRSSYALFFGVPVAMLGMVHYAILIAALLATYYKRRLGPYLLLIQSTAGFLFSVYFVWLQLAVLRAICLYCMVSAVLSMLIFILVQRTWPQTRKRIKVRVIGLLYTTIVKRIFFLISPQIVHDSLTQFGETIGGLGSVRAVTTYLVCPDIPQLGQTISGITFRSPVGLAAGFDYEAKLTQILAPWGFGFQTVGTITNRAYEGNPPPMLGRLPQSRSLMVNKGFKNPGAQAIVTKLTDYTFVIPVGISIGRTNLREATTQKESVADIISAFTTFEQSPVKHSYYELNISCPNLYGNVSFYPPANLRELLTEVDSLHLKKPVFIKMPIEKTNSEILQMLEVIAHHSPAGVIFGNLQKNRHDPSLVPVEVAKFKTGNFSGKPTFHRSNELIRLAYEQYRSRFTIIGCGGVFNGADAYLKIKLGASLIQLITGMIYKGPQLAAQIQFHLEDSLKKDRFTHLSQAIGADHK